jgi:hypothetical protein
MLNSNSGRIVNIRLLRPTTTYQGCSCALHRSFATHLTPSIVCTRPFLSVLRLLPRFICPTQPLTCSACTLPPHRPLHTTTADFVIYLQHYFDNESIEVACNHVYARNSACGYFTSQCVQTHCGNWQIAASESDAMKLLSQNMTYSSII